MGSSGEESTIALGYDNAFRELGELRNADIMTWVEEECGCCEIAFDGIGHGN